MAEHTMEGRDDEIKANPVGQTPNLSSVLYLEPGIQVTQPGLQQVEGAVITLQLYYYL